MTKRGAVIFLRGGRAFQISDAEARKLYLALGVEFAADGPA